MLPLVAFELSPTRFVCVVGLLVLVSTLSTHGVMSGFSTTRGWVGFFAALVAPIGAIGDARVHGFRIVGLTRPFCGRAARPVDLWRTTGGLDRICAHHHPPGSNPSFDPLYTKLYTASLPNKMAEELATLRPCARAPWPWQARRVIHCDDTHRARFCSCCPPHAHERGAAHRRLFIETRAAAHG